MLRTRLPRFLALAAALAAPACELEGEPDLGSTDDEILGDLNVESSCDSDVQSFVRDSMFITRVVVTSDAFEQCVQQAVMDSTRYKPCRIGSDGDPVVSRGEHLRNALDASRSVNDVRAGCQDGDAWGRAGLGDDPGFYGEEAFAFEDRTELAVDEIGWRLCRAGENPADHSCRGAAFPYPYTEVGATIIHENLHRHAYWHSSDTQTCNGDATYSDVANSIPWIVDQCLIRVMNDSQATCGDICGTRTGDDISSCRNRGSLMLVDGLGSTTCEAHYDAGMYGLGFIQETAGRFEAEDMWPDGQRLPGGWIAGTLDKMTVDGQLIASAPDKRQYVVRSAWGVGVIEWDPVTGFRGRGGAPWNTVLAHSGDGSGVLFLRSTDELVAAGRFTADAQDTILVRTRSSGFAIVAANGSGFVTRSRYGWGTVVPGTYGSFTLSSDTQVLGTGDFNNDGRDDIFVKSSWGYAVLSRTGSGGTLRAIDVRQYGHWIGSWNHGSTNQIVAVADFDGSGRASAVIRSGWGLGLIGIPSGSSRLTTLWLAPNGTGISGLWTMRATDRIPLHGRLHYTYKDSLLLQGADGFAIVTFNSSSKAPYITSALKRSIGQWVGGWHYGDSNQFVAVGDFEGDGYDSFVVRSGWGYGVLGRNRYGGALIQEMGQQYDCGGTGAEACHDGLLGSWLARQTDEIFGVLRDAGGKDALVLHSVR